MLLAPRKRLHRWEYRLLVRVYPPAEPTDLKKEKEH